jgi:hypothetical protein
MSLELATSSVEVARWNLNADLRRDACRSIRFGLRAVRGISTGAATARMWRVIRGITLHLRGAPSGMSESTGAPGARLGLASAYEDAPNPALGGRKRRIRAGESQMAGSP